MSDASSISPDRIKRIDAINASLSGGRILRYDATDTAIAQGETEAFENRVRDLATQLASDNGRRGATQDEINAMMSVSRLRLEGGEKRVGLSRIRTLLIGRQAEVEAQRAMLEAEERAIIEIDNQHDSLLGRRDDLAAQVSRAESYYDEIEKRTVETEAGLPDFVLIGAAAKPTGTPLYHIWDTYQSWQSALFALSDRERVMAILNARLAALDEEIAAFKTKHDR